MDFMIQTTLYFGLEMSNGNVTRLEFDEFVNDVVTPAFPNGLTIIDARGQWMSPVRGLVHEGTKVLVLLHHNSIADNNHINFIRLEYKKKFFQDSVLRVDVDVEVDF